jgi:CrcB protein
MTGYLFVCLGAAVGAPLRYLVDRAVQSRHDSVMPWGTLVVNLVGSFVLGVLTGLADGHAVPADVTLAIGTGGCGALTTYSTFSFETLRLVEEGAGRAAALNVLLSLSAGVAAAVLGIVVGATF